MTIVIAGSRGQLAQYGHGWAGARLSRHSARAGMMSIQTRQRDKFKTRRTALIRMGSVIPTPASGSGLGGELAQHQRCFATAQSEATPDKVRGRAYSWTITPARGE